MNTVKTEQKIKISNNWKLKEEFNESEILLDPKNIVSKIDETIYGQSSAKRKLALVLHQHYKRYRLSLIGKEIPKMNVCLFGPSGCGKTLLADTISKIVKLPVLYLNTIDLVNKDYYIEYFQNKLNELVLKDPSRAKYSIVIIDEIDKLSLIDDLATQYELTDIIDGHSYRPVTRNVLFILMGAFERLTNSSWRTGIITHEDLIDYGLVPELVYRFGILIQMDRVNEDTLLKFILKTLNEHRSLQYLSNQEIHVYGEIILSQVMANKAYERTGLRCVRPYVWNFIEGRIYK